MPSLTLSRTGLVCQRCVSVTEKTLMQIKGPCWLSDSAIVYHIHVWLEDSFVIQYLVHAVHFPTWTSSPTLSGTKWPAWGLQFLRQDRMAEEDETEAMKVPVSAGPCSLLAWPLGNLTSLITGKDGRHVFRWLVVKIVNCGFSSNWILLYFPLFVCPSVCHRRDISHFSHI